MLISGRLFKESIMLRTKRFFFIMFLAVFFLNGCGEKIEPGNVELSDKGAIKAPVDTAKIITQPFYYESVGTVSAKIVSTISSKLMGSVKEVFVREGDRVTTGDRLANIDDRQVVAMLRQAKAALAEAQRAETAARANAELANATYTRYRNLMKDASASPQEFDEVQSRYQQAQAGLAAAKQRVKKAEASLSSAAVSAKDELLSPGSEVLSPSGRTRAKARDRKAARRVPARASVVSLRMRARLSDSMASTRRRKELFERTMPAASSVVSDVRVTCSAIRASIFA